MNRHIKYLKYAILHKWIVFKECAKRGQLWRGLVHDLSKFLPCEYFPYVDHFYGVNNQSAFDHAWNRHQKSNKHHWQYWVLTPDDGEPKALEIPRHYVIELVSDWYSAGMVITGGNNLAKWYSANKGKMILHPNTRNYIEHLIFNDFDVQIPLDKPLNL